MKEEHLWVANAQTDAFLLKMLIWRGQRLKAEPTTRPDVLNEEAVAR